MINDEKSINQQFSKGHSISLFIWWNYLFWALELEPKVDMLEYIHYSIPKPKIGRVHANIFLGILNLSNVTIKNKNFRYRCFIKQYLWFGSSHINSNQWREWCRYWKLYDFPSITLSWILAPENGGILSWGWRLWSPLSKR